MPRIQISRFPEAYAEEFAGRVSEDRIQGGRFIHDIWVEPPLRGRGVGGALLRDEIRKADTEHRCLFLQAYPYEVVDRGGTIEDFAQAQEKLIGYYRRFGFEHVGSGFMFRHFAGTKARQFARSGRTAA